MGSSTPGPWKVVKTDEIGIARLHLIHPPEEHQFGFSVVTNGDHTRIMRLIAAAPELLEAAAGLVALIGHGEGGPFKPDPAGTYNERVEALFAAIAKAEGRAP